MGPDHRNTNSATGPDSGGQVRAGEDQLARIHYEWTINNLVDSRDEYTSIDPKDPASATVDFTYDLRGRLIREERVSSGSDDYDFSYTYDQVGNRLTKLDNLADPPERVRYLYDVTDPGNCPVGFETHNNRLMKYVEETYVEPVRGEGDWVETRNVAYTYYRTGHASNITVKDYKDPVYRDLALYYDVQGRLVVALWDSWELITKGKDAGLPDEKTYAKDRAVEFRYENTDARQRYMMRALNEEELPDIVPLASPLGQWTEYLGSVPFVDAEFEQGDGKTFAKTREYDPTVEREVGGDELHLHGDLIGSTIAGTDDEEAVVGRIVYTAFGEPIGTPTLTGTRYRFAGAWGYEEGLLALNGAPNTAPIVLLHVGERWYQPELGRFVQRDPIGLLGGQNVYEYAHSVPTNGTDPSEMARVDPTLPNKIKDIIIPWTRIQGLKWWHVRPTLGAGAIRVGPVPGGGLRLVLGGEAGGWGRGIHFVGRGAALGGTGALCVVAVGVGAGTGWGLNWITKKLTGRSISERIGDWVAPPIDHNPSWYAIPPDSFN